MGRDWVRAAPAVVIAFIGRARPDLVDAGAATAAICEEAMAVPLIGLQRLQAADDLGQVLAVLQEPAHPLLEAGQAVNDAGLEDLDGDERKQSHQGANPERDGASWPGLAVRTELAR